MADVVPYGKNRTTGQIGPIDVSDVFTDDDGNNLSTTKSLHVVGFDQTDESTPDMVDLSTAFPKAAFDASTREELQVEEQLPTDAEGSTVTVKLKLQMSTANTGNVRLGLTLATDGGAFGSESNETINPSDSADTVEIITLSTTLSITAGQWLVLKIARVAGDAADTHTGEMELLEVIFEYQAKVAE